MKVKKLDRRYNQCRHNDYWYALYFTGRPNGLNLEGHRVKCKLVDHYGPTQYAMFNNPCPWYNEYKNYAKDEVIYLRDASMITFLQLSGVLDNSNELLI